MYLVYFPHRNIEKATKWTEKTPMGLNNKFKFKKFNFLNFSA